MSTPRGTMTADQFLEWVDTHPTWPPHAFEEPCGKAEGTDRCWLCGSNRAAHTALVQHTEETE